MNNYSENIKVALEKFSKIIEDQLKRVEDMKSQGDFVDYASLDKIRIGVCGGDGIGPIISKSAESVLRFMLKD
jgi:isocitrate dehydrogenase (NAD+)